MTSGPRPRPQPHLRPARKPRPRDRHRALRRQPFPTEAELARQHGVSRSVTREAVKMLTAKGLLSARPRQGTMVQPSRAVEPVRHRRAALAARAQILDRPAAPVQRASRRDRAGGGGARRDLCRRRPARRDRRRARADGGGRGRAATTRSTPTSPSTSPSCAPPAIPSTCSSATWSSTALRTSIRFTNRFKGHSASVPEHDAVRDAIVARRPGRARQAMRGIIVDVLALIGEAGRGPLTGIAS